MKQIRPPAREAIIEAAFEVYADRPAASLADVADRAGVGRATLHRYFPGRADLMRALALVAIEELDRAVAAQTAGALSYTDGLRLSLHAIVPLASRQWFLAREEFSHEPDIAAAYEASRSDLHAHIEAARREGAFATDIPTPWIAEVFEGLIYAAWTQVRSGDATPSQAAALAWRTLTRGLQGDAT